MLDLTGVTPVFDYFVVTNGTNRRQMVAIGDKSDDVMAAAGSDRIGVEGHEGGTWILHDYGDVVLHIFDSEARRNYDLENLWADAKSIDWREALNQAEGASKD